VRHSQQQSDIHERLIRKAPAAYADLRKSACTSCRAKADLSAYWQPQLYFAFRNGSFASVQQANGGLNYYLPRHHSTDKTKVLAFPEGFKMLAGSPLRRTYNASSLVDQAIGWNCLGATGVKETRVPGLPQQNCPDGLRGVRRPGDWVSWLAGEANTCPRVLMLPLPRDAGDSFPVVLVRQGLRFARPLFTRCLPNRARVWPYVPGPCHLEHREIKS